MNSFKIVIVGLRPLLMSNARLSNPLDPIRKELSKLTSKRTKTETDHREIAHLEWLGGLYFTEQSGPYLPGENIEKALVEGARLTRAGKKIERGVVIDTEVNPLAYDGPRTLDELWNARTEDTDGNTAGEAGGEHRAFALMKSVVVQRARTIRTRPRFTTWAVSAVGRYDDSVISLEELRTVASTAGNMIGLGDYRPRYGRFTAQVTEQDSAEQGGSTQQLTPEIARTMPAVVSTVEA